MNEDNKKVPCNGALHVFSGDSKTCGCGLTLAQAMKAARAYINKMAEVKK